MSKGRSLPQLAITWVLGNRAVSVALVAMHSERELHENVAAAGWRLQSSGEESVWRARESVNLLEYDRVAVLKHDGG